jgi:hypothetical protein
MQFFTKQKKNYRLAKIVSISGQKRMLLKPGNKSAIG